MDSFCYAGIGARATPEAVLSVMTNIARNLELTGFTLRSGGAAGADSAFEEGVVHDIHKQIFLPWRGFNGNKSTRCNISKEAYRLAELYHPAWHRCSHYAKDFHARNGYQVLGEGLNNPSDFILCWTPEGAVTGGTGQALRIAMVHDIPIFNMASPGWDDEFHSWLKWFLEQPAKFEFEAEGDCDHSCGYEPPDDGRGPGHCYQCAKPAY